MKLIPTHTPVDRSEQLIELFEQASQIEASRRADFLAEACGGDDEMCRELESLLSHANDGAAALPSSAIKLAARQFADASRRDWAGQQVSHYRILRLLGAGGMGEVWLAEDTRLNRQVAIKFLTANLISNTALLHRFEQEARAASALNHPNILVVHEIGQHEEDRFIVTEFIEGQTLQQRLAQARLTIKDAIDIAAQVASALRAAHSAGIFHRDIKPENIMLREDGVAKVLDFGIAKRGRGEAEFEIAPSPRRPVALSLTAAGAVMGTASYMSPEQARGLTVDGRSDLFSLGAVMYEMTMGERLFANATPAEVTEQLLRPQEPLPSAAKFDGQVKPLEPMIRKCLRRQREQRYASAAELLGELQRLKRQLETRFIRRVVAAISLVAVLAIAAIGWGIPASIHEEWVEMRMHDGHARRAQQLALSPDGQTLVSVGFDQKVIVWNLASRTRRATLNGHTGPVAATAFSPDGKWLATAANDNRVIIWDTAHWAKAAVLPGSSELTDTIAFTPDGRLFIGRNDVWEVGTWRKVANIAINVPFLLSPDGHRLVRSDWQVFDLSSGKKVSGSNGEQSLGDGTLSPDGKHLAAVDNGGLVGFWDMSQFWRAGERKLINRYLAHRDHGHAMAYSPDGRMVASGSENIILWDARTHEKLARFTAQDTVNSLIFSRDSRQIISAHGDGTIMIWDIAEKEPLANLAEHCGPVHAASFSPDGQSIVTASEDHSVIIWDAASGLKRAVLIGHHAPVVTAVFSADGQQVLSADFSGNAILWDAMTGDRLRAFATARSRDIDFNYRAALSPDKQWVATTFGVYSVADGRLVMEFFPHRDDFAPETHGLDFSPNGRWLVCVGTGGHIALWDVAEWRPYQTLNIQGNYNAVAFSPDSRQLAIGNNTGEITLWQVEPLQQIGVMKRHMSGIESLAFAPDGRVLASAGDDESVALWDVARRRFIANVGRHILPVLAVGFAPDGRRLVTGEHDQSVRVYTRQLSLWGKKLDESGWLLRLFR